MLEVPFTKSTFKLDVSGIAGFFGGEEAFAAMSTVHLIRGRRWLGLYNSPGSYFVAKKYGVLAKSKVWNGLFPGVNDGPTKMLGLDGKDGPKYVALHSGTRLDKTGHLAHLFAAHCEDNPGHVESLIEDPAKNLPSVYLTIAHLEHLEDIKLDIAANQFSSLDPVAIIPIGCSVGACIISAVFREWFAFGLILLGIFSNGIASFVIGSGILEVRTTNPSKNAPPGDGILESFHRVILLKANERVAQVITKGKFELKFSDEKAPGEKGEEKYNDIGWSALFLTIQFLAQLFFIPQATLFGQAMFLSSLAVSWLYNAYLASVDTEKLQRKFLAEHLLGNPVIETVRLPKRTALVVFAAVYTETDDPRGFLDIMIPNNTPVWRLVKETITKAILADKDPSEVVVSRVDELNEKDRLLFHDMLKQATTGYNGAKNHKFYGKESDSKA